MGDGSHFHFDRRGARGLKLAVDHHRNLLHARFPVLFSGISFDWRVASPNKSNKASSKFESSEC